jgi:hypothetical protein
VADEGGALVSQRQHQVAQTAGEAAERVVAAARRRGAVAGEVGGDHGVVDRQRLDHRFPVDAGPGHPVDQQQDRPGAGFDEADRVAVDVDRPRSRLGHVQTGHFACHGENLPTRAAEVSQRRDSVTDSNTVAL